MSVKQPESAQPPAADKAKPQSSDKLLSVYGYTDYRAYRRDFYGFRKDG